VSSSAVPAGLREIDDAVDTIRDGRLDQ